MIECKSGSFGLFVAGFMWYNCATNVFRRSSPLVYLEHLANFLNQAIEDQRLFRFMSHPSTS